MALRIAFDLDGVLADMDGELIRQAHSLFGEAMTQKLQVRAAVEEPAAAEPGHADAPLDVPLLKLNMTSRQTRRLWHHVELLENFWETLKEIEPGVIERLAALATDRRWEIIFVTRRPESAGATAQVQSQRWLESKGFARPAVYVTQGSRGKIAAALGLDVVIDDRPENCLDVVADSKARAILVWREEPKDLPTEANRLGIGVVRSVAECLDILIQIDSVATVKPGMIDRALQLLGLKQPARA